MYNLKVIHFIDASHQLTNTETLVTKKCANLHGHTYKIEVYLYDIELVNGMVVDFKQVKNVIDILDHRHINDVFKENDYLEESTAENIARFIYEALEVKLRCRIDKVVVYEGYKGEQSPSVTYGPISFVGTSGTN